MTLQEFLQKPKTDLHHHAALGFSKTWAESVLCKKLPDISYITSIEAMSQYIKKHLRHEFSNLQIIEQLFRYIFLNAKKQNITRIESSFDMYFLMNKPIEKIFDLINQLHQTLYPELIFKKEIGFPREADLNIINDTFDYLSPYNFFNGIDIYGIELARPPKAFVPIVSKAKKQGLYIKIHTGEYGTWQNIAETIDVLMPDAIQHGISAVDSDKLCQKLADTKLPLHMCPSSNLKLNRIKNINQHPIKKLLLQGVLVTINTDDIFFFNSTINDEYALLFNNKTLSLNELEQIRQNGLSINY